MLTQKQSELVQDGRMMRFPLFDSIKVGQYNEIPLGTLRVFKEMRPGPVVIGDCNVIHEGVRFLVGPGGFRMGDWNVVHNHTTIGGPGSFSMGHNCWIGQDSYLDTTGGLTVGNGVTMGLSTHIWTHIARGERIEGWRFDLGGKVVIGNDVWLVGDGIHVSPNVTMGARSAAMAHSTVTRDTLPDTVYAGTPAREVSFRLRREISLQEKYRMMQSWACDFTMGRGVSYREHTDYSSLIGSDGLIIFGANIHHNDVPPTVSSFDLTTKTYTKRLTPLERDFIQFLQGNKARFLPVEAG